MAQRQQIRDMRSLEKRHAVALDDAQKMLRREAQKRRDALMAEAEQSAQVTFDHIERAFPSDSATPSMMYDRSQNVRHGGMRAAPSRPLPRVHVVDDVGGPPVDYIAAQTVKMQQTPSSPSRKRQRTPLSSKQQEVHTPKVPKVDPSLATAQQHQLLKLTEPDALHCLCQTKYNPRKFYVCCDLCSRWYHGACVGISERQSANMSEFVCQQCKQETPKINSQFCICKTPYDDKQYYVGCDGCEGWFHPRCVGISRE